MLILRFTLKTGENDLNHDPDDRACTIERSFAVSLYFIFIT